MSPVPPSRLRNSSADLSVKTVTVAILSFPTRTLRPPSGTSGKLWNSNTQLSDGSHLTLIVPAASRLMRPLRRAIARRNPCGSGRSFWSRSSVFADVKRMPAGAGLLAIREIAVEADRGCSVRDAATTAQLPFVLSWSINEGLSATVFVKGSFVHFGIFPFFLRARTGCGLPPLVRWIDWNPISLIGSRLTHFPVLPLGGGTRGHAYGDRAHGPCSLPGDYPGNISFW